MGESHEVRTLNPKPYTLNAHLKGKMGESDEVRLERDPVQRVPDVKSKVSSHH
jgi:hypothetical protein